MAAPTQNSVNEWGFLCRAMLDHRATSACAGWITDRAGQLFWERRDPDSWQLLERHRFSRQQVAGALRSVVFKQNPTAPASIEAIRAYFRADRAPLYALLVTLTLLGVMLGVRASGAVPEGWAPEARWSLVLAPASSSALVALGLAVRRGRRVREVDALLASRGSEEPRRQDGVRPQLALADELGGRQFYFAQPLFRIVENPPRLEDLPGIGGDAHDPTAWAFNRWWGLVRADRAPYSWCLWGEGGNLMLALRTYLENQEKELNPGAFNRLLEEVFSLLDGAYIDGGCFHRKRPFLDSIYLSYVMQGTYKPEADNLASRLALYLVRCRRDDFDRIALATRAGVQRLAVASESTVAMGRLRYRFHRDFHLGPCSSVAGNDIFLPFGLNEDRVGHAFVAHYRSNVPVEQTAELLDTDRTLAADRALKGEIAEWFSGRYSDWSGTGDGISGRWYPEAAQLLLWRQGLLTEHRDEAAVLQVR